MSNLKFTCTKENLYQGLTQVTGLTSRSVGLPILNNLLIEVKNGVLNLSATNLEIGIKTEVRGKAERAGSFTVGARVLTDYVAILPDDNITLELIENQLVVNCGNYQTKIRGQGADEFPIIPQLKEVNGLVLEAEIIKKSLSQTTYATSFDEMRPEINGVLFSFKDKNLVLAATDSYRLAEKKIKLDNLKTERQVIMPLKTLQVLEQVLSTTSEPLEVFVEENQVMFKIKPTLIISRLIEGHFPEYQQIIPTKFVTRAKLKKEDLIQATRAAALFTRTGINDINLKLADQRLEIKTSNSQLGEQQTLLSGEVKGEPVTVVFNYKYLLDGLQVLEGEAVLLEINSNSAPVILRSDQDDSFVYLIMPIKQ